MFRTLNTDHTCIPVILHTLRQDDGSSRRECLIYYNNLVDDIIYLKYGQCRWSVHLGYIGEWLK